ncbi:MAG: response regulator, partial [Geobacteraceae bacterium]|nr:response regulator [Geobacteraceae bacterium]
MPGGGKITVRAENFTLFSENIQRLPAGHYVKLSFIDEGCGIKEEDQKKVFDPYYTTKAGGTGLGLASAHSIISRHGGCIDIDSRINKGTTITFYLPSLESRDTETLTEAGSQQDPCSTGGNILVMDDEEMIRSLTQEMLEHLGYKVTTCINGEQAITFYNSALQSGNSFDAVILDITIRGGMGGMEAAQTILAGYPSAKLIMSSGYSNYPVMAEYKKFGILKTLTKPYNAEDLRRVLGVCRA